MLDPGDERRCVHALLAVHAVAAGVLVCPATPGAPWPVLVRDLLLALGKQRRALELAGRRSRLPEVLAVWPVDGTRCSPVDRG